MDLDTEVGKNIERAYQLIKKSVSNGIPIDSLEVVKQVEEYRQFWKPERIKVALLAESHVYTNEKDFEIECDGFILHRIVPNYPLRFVRFVYCLGYGEDKLLTRKRPDMKNTGTPQYWKIFSSCVAENEDELGFHGILSTKTPSFITRLHNKVSVLQKMKDKGIWLLDTSIIGLYGTGQKNRENFEKILETSWKNHVSNLLTEVVPKHIIVIGKGVGSILRFNLRNLGVPFTVIPQPQARVTSECQLENYKTYQRICAKCC